MKEMQNRFEPWVLKQLPAGGWVVDQLGLSMCVRRYGPFATEALAREVYSALKEEPSEGQPA